MTRAATVLLTVSLVALLGACGEPSQPAGPALDGASTPAFSHAAPAPRLLMLDACDPESFNAAFGFDVCTPVHRKAGISFATFIALLEKNQQVDAWRFAPDVIHVTRPVTMAVPNHGGIPHSFTEVEEFGGGFIPLLNVLSGNVVPAPECVHPDNAAAPHPDVRLIAPGDHDVITFEPGETKKYMCCIHPWMRAASR